MFILSWEFKMTYVWRVYYSPSFNEQFHQLIVSPTSRQMQNTIFYGFFNKFDLWFSIVHQQLSANIYISGIYGGKKWNISILEKKQKYVI